MKFDVIIATFNRKESLAILVSQILKCSKLPSVGHSAPAAPDDSVSDAARIQDIVNKFEI